MIANVPEGFLDPQVVHTIVVPTVVRAQILGLVCQNNACHKAHIRECEAQIDNHKKDAAAHVVQHNFLLYFVSEGQ